MDSDVGKVFVGGVSWETTEDTLRKHFSSYGSISDAVIMRDRATGRARGFGFVVFSDPSVADTVVLEKHVIEGRTVGIEVDLSNFALQICSFFPFRYDVFLSYYRKYAVVFSSYSILWRYSILCVLLDACSCLCVIILLSVLVLETRNVVCTFLIHLNVLRHRLLKDFS